MKINRRPFVALAVMLTALVVLALVAAHRAGSPAPQPSPAGNVSVVEQAPATVDTATANGAVTNTVDPPAAHDSDMPTGTPEVTTTPPKPAAPQTEYLGTPLITTTENGTAIALKPITSDPEPPVATSPPPSISEDPCSTPAGCQK